MQAYFHNLIVRYIGLRFLLLSAFFNANVHKMTAVIISLLIETMGWDDIGIGGGGKNTLRSL